MPGESQSNARTQRLPAYRQAVLPLSIVVLAITSLALLGEFINWPAFALIGGCLLAVNWGLDNA